MKFNIYFDLTGPGGKVKQVPNTNNPVECENLASLLLRIADNLPKQLNIVTAGIRIEECEEKV